MGLNVEHGPDFFAQMRTRAEPYKRLGECYVEVLDHACALTAYDFGCGVGFQTARIASLGIGIVGVDPFCDGPAPGFHFRKEDPIGRSYPRRDAVICTETAEHVYEERAEDLVALCADSASRVIIWSAAPPGCEWEGHVNLKPHAWWLAKFSRRQWQADASATLNLRRRMVETGAQHCGAPGNFFALVRTP